MVKPLDNSVNVTFFLFKGLILKIIRVRGIVNTCLNLFLGFDAHKMIFFTKKKDRDVLNKIKINGFFTAIPQVYRTHKIGESQIIRNKKQ